jgi:enamine deaminase RidA (YjgF/YER057c/UK114 family)
MERERVSAQTVWEDVVGYSRAIRVGNHISVSETAATDSDGVVHGEGDISAQSVYILKKIDEALLELGASLPDVVRTRIFITEVDEWKGVAKAHSEVLGRVRPCTTMVEVSNLLTPELLVEIEVDAILEA